VYNSYVRSIERLYDAIEGRSSSREAVMTTLTTLTTLPARPVPVPAQRPAARSVRVIRPARARLHTHRFVVCERSAPADLHGSRLTPRGRAAVGLVWLVLAVLAAVPVLRLDGGQDELPRVTTTVVVEPGDTLWALAREIDAAADPRAVIDNIVELNGLSPGADIHPGDVLVVPGPG
jgi:nucleoid-associated protein YgaU